MFMYRSKVPVVVCYNETIMRALTRSRHSPLRIILPIVGIGGLLVAAGLLLPVEQQRASEQRRSDQLAAEARQIRDAERARIARVKSDRDTADARALDAVQASVASAQSITGRKLPTKSAQCNDLTRHYDPARADVLVNKRHCLTPLNFAPRVTTVAPDIHIADIAHDSYRQMIAAAAAANLPLRTTSGYRSYDDQTTVYKHWATIETLAVAETSSARPGYSEHQTGLAIDFAAGGCALECFTNTPQRAWLMTHAAEFGFIERYPVGKEAVTGYDHESWHYRYVGRETATRMKSSHVATLEELWNIRGGGY